MDQRGNAKEKSLAQRYRGAALVTGASAGIGEALVRQLAQQGCDLVLVARREERLRAVADEVAKEHKVKTLVLAQDLTQPDAPRVLFERTREADLEIGILVNNAGFGLYGPFAEHDPRTAQAMVDLNCRAVVGLTYAFLPQMLRRGNGAIVFVSSIAGFQPTPFYAIYGATKGFDLMLAEALWAELKDQGIDVLALCPGYTPTEFQQVASSPQRKVVSSVEEVARAGLEALGHRASVVPGGMNKLMTWANRLVPRKTVAKWAHRYSKPK